VAALEHFDVVIVGAGLSGIDAAHHLQELCRRRTYAILEQRERIGGTWDLFRYPGIRSDSDMFTMGYSFRPWTKPKAISPGEDIREYIEETAREEGIDGHIRFRHAVERASWSSHDARWMLEGTRRGPDGREVPFAMTCEFLFCCAGYYRYSAGYTPQLPGIERFEGGVVHPQAWPEDLDYAGKRVVVVGSGATAVTLVPAMARTAAHVTMLQRSPTWIVAMPEEDRIANRLRAALPAAWAHRLSRWKNIAYMWFMYKLARRSPAYVKKGLLRQASAHLGSAAEVATHFTPRYDPWEQRLCLVPDADLFVAIREGRASVATDHIRTFTEKGVVLESGRELPADVVVTATGLVMQPLGGIELCVDGNLVDLCTRLSYKGVMLSGVPNLATVFGYVNASWTLKADLICEWVCRLLNAMERRGARKVTPTARDDEPAAPFVEHFTPGYVQRALAGLPKQGRSSPWRVHQDYLRDTITLKWSRVEDDALVFSGRDTASPSHGQELGEVETPRSM
jgi:cation diffusion facilitator CzcD-associated flavoprotein CzcO